MAITAITARYISLDNKGFEIGALEFGEIRLAGLDIPDELAQEGDLEKMVQHLLQLGYQPEAAACEANKAKDFYGLGADCLWVTFERGQLWWTFAHPHVLWMADDVGLIERVRKSIGGWRNTDVNGDPLQISRLGGGILRFSDRSGPPDAETLRDLLQLINGAEVSQSAEPWQPAATKVAARTATNTETTFSTEIPSTLFTVSDVVKTPSAAPDEAGVYAWWFDELPDVPLAGAHEQNGFRLAYIGIASYRPGSRRTLRQRLHNHCNGPIATSTLRRSLAAILIDKLDLHPYRVPGQKVRLPDEEESRLSNWLAEHARVAWIANAAPWIYETQLLQSGPPLALNIRGNSHGFVRKLLAMRQQLSGVPSSVLGFARDRA